MQISCLRNIALSAPNRKGSLFCPSKNGAGVDNSTTHDLAPLASCGEAYFLRGWRGVIRCYPRSKRPVGDAWRPPHDLAELRAWVQAMPLANIGLAAVDGVGWIDQDFDDPEIDAALHSVMPRSLMARRGKTGQAEAFRFAPGQRSFKIMRRDQPSKPLIEVMASSGFVVVPPSIHPDGPSYGWTTPGNPLNLWPSDLFMQPATIEAEIRRAMAPWGKPLPEPVEMVFRPAGALSDDERRRYGLIADAALASYRRQISALGKGGRSFRIYAMGKSLAPYVREGILTPDEIHAAAIEAAGANGFLDEAGLGRVAKDVSNGLKDGADTPLRDLDKDPHWGRR